VPVIGRIWLGVVIFRCVMETYVGLVYVVDNIFVRLSVVHSDSPLFSRNKILFVCKDYIINKGYNSIRYYFVWHKCRGDNMGKKFKPLTPKYPHMLHGGDYNPDQWIDYPEIIEKDIELMKKAHINNVSLGIFSWAHLEPKKDVFEFEWLDKVIEKLYEAGIYINLATPSGARPHWLADEYPEVLRVDEKGVRAHFGFRHNHCMTSPVYRERVRIINTKLAQRYGKHPAVIMWHISNEYGGECHCPLCQQAFRDYLKEKYVTVEKMNHAWWARFWSHTYSSFDEVESPGAISETAINGLWLDWWRFTTYQTTDFMKNEIAAVKAVNPEIPVTTNMMGLYDGLCYPKLAKEIDFVSWDSYPYWHVPNENVKEAYTESFTHDYIRCLKMKPFILMESTTGTVNWRPVSKMKKPGMHRLAILNAIGHGAESGLYFQIRQSRGSAEKMHSAVISHTGTENTRVFKEVSELGADMKKISDLIYGSDNPAAVAIIYDKESKWALNQSNGPRNCGLDYDGLCTQYYKYFWQNGIGVDVLDSSADFKDYKIVIAPMLYMYHNDIQDKLRKYVEAGGILLSTAFSGVADENDLCFLGEATDEKLSDVFGMWVEEIDALFEEEFNETFFGNDTYKLRELCEVIHTTTAETLAVYGNDYYKDFPVITKNKYGKGIAYHIAANCEIQLIEKMCSLLAEEAKITGILGNVSIPDGIGINYRENEAKRYIFVGNFSDKEKTVSLSKTYTNILNDGVVFDDVKLEPYGIVILEEDV